jgi:FAD/FMN-containing dehydrogenase
MSAPTKGGAIGADGVEELRALVAGEVVAPGDGEYDAARRVWNWMVDRRPGAVVRVADESDVATAVRFAADNGILLAVRGGGHSVAGQGTCDAGMVIDLGRIDGVDVDDGSGLVRAGGGCLLRDVDRVCASHGRVVPAGVVSHTGAGGLTLGGGVGWLSRKFGLTCDNVASFRVVLPSGEIVTADESQNADLYWGLRGGGGNFGIVTEFAYRSHPFPTEIPVGLGFWPLKDAEAVLRAQAERMHEQPDEWKATTFVIRPAEGSPAPPELVGKPTLMVLQVWADDDLAAAERSFDLYRDAATPALATVEPMAFTTLQSLSDDSAGPGRCNYTKGGYLDDDFGDGAIAAMIESAEEMLNDNSLIEVIPHGGAQLRVGDDDTAFPDRQAAYSFNVFARWPLEEDDDAHVAWARTAFDRLDRHAGDGVYVNFFNPHEGGDQTRVLAAFGRERYDKLAALKARYDPTNVLSLNPNIFPAEAA